MLQKGVFNSMIAISSDDDKRVIMADGIHTLDYGHTKLKKLQLKNELQ